ncbi:PAS-domain containing protein [Nitrogeniibacter aestuarii]|uniref:PAS-domain containing protein n=1 Tax=Nitrogeniibacter aestuarii TaxID=2815343 RepID=UPI001D0FF000|nr:PAS-domain containing protein [Nitrogeniibacter aestuarii]
MAHALPDSMSRPQVTDSRYREMVSAALDHISEGITVFDADLRLVTCNRAFLDLLAFPDTLAVPGTPFEAFIRHNAERGEYGPGDVDELVARRVADAETFRAHETRRRRPDGTVLLIRGYPLPHAGFITLYSDITELEQQQAEFTQHQATLEAHIAERTEALTRSNRELREALAYKQEMSVALRHSESRLRQITDTIPAHIAYFDHTRVYRYANKRYAEWFDRTVEAMVDAPIPEVIGQALADALEAHISASLAGAEVTYEYSKLGPDGARLYARSTLLPEFDADGKVLGCFVHSVDITDQRRTQNALAHAQKMEAIGQLTGGLAHDFNNMLTVVMGNLTGLRDAMPEAEEIEEYVVPAMSAAEGGAALIQRLLTFSRQQASEPMEVEVNALVLDIARLIRRSVPRSIQVSTRSLDDDLMTRAEPHQLQSAILNLALNARDAMPNGGQIDIECSLETLDGPAANDLEIAPGEYVQIAVTDNGTGIDGSILDRVFEPFFTTKRFGMGSGLGLSMVYGFVKQSAGGVRIRSRQAVGTTVALLLPKVETSLAAAPASSASQPQTDIENLLVLLVEDQANVRKVVRQHLAVLGCHVLEAENGNEAADIIERVPAIGLVLSDVVMPGGMNGLDLVRFTRRLRPSLPLLLMSGYAEHQHTEDDDRLTRVLPKPFSRLQLRDALQAVLGADAPTWQRETQ